MFKDFFFPFWFLICASFLLSCLCLESGDEPVMLSWDLPVLWAWELGVDGEDSGLWVVVGIPKQPATGWCCVCVR